MAQYKVPQDIEADDKLLGPFSFRQFVYLFIAVGLCFVAFLLFNIFPLLVIIPIPFILFLAVLALPLKKDQPMETYVSAIVDFYMKPQKRIWMPGQADTAITITAPKQTETSRTKDLSEAEAGRRLSFLANIVDTEGYAIKDASNLRDDIASEAANTEDIFEKSHTYNIDHSIAQSNEARRAQLVQQMRNAIVSSANNTSAPTIQAHTNPAAPTVNPLATVTPAQKTTLYKPDLEHSSSTIQPDVDEIHSLYHPDEKPKSEPEPIPEPMPEPEVAPASEPEPEPEPQPEPTPKPKPSAPEPNADLKNLANNSDFSIATIAEQAKRINDRKANDGEVYVSLH